MSSGNKVSNLTKEDLTSLTKEELINLLKIVNLEIENASARTNGKMNEENDLLKEAKKYKKLILRERGRRIREEVSSSTDTTANNTTSSGTSNTSITQPLTSLQRIALRPRVKVPRVRQITEELHNTWREREWWPLVNRPRGQQLQSGIINITIPDYQEYPEYSGVTDMHVHIFPNRNQGSGIRIGFGPDDNMWRLEYNIRNGIGTYNIRNPDGNFVPHNGFSENLPLDKLIKKIQNQLKKENMRKNSDVPNNLLNISYNNLDYLIHTMTYLMEGVQSRRIYGGKIKQKILKKTILRKRSRKINKRKTKRRRKTNQKIPKNTFLRKRSRKIKKRKLNKKSRRRRTRKHK